MRLSSLFFRSALKYLLALRQKFREERPSAIISDQPCTLTRTSSSSLVHAAELFAQLHNTLGRIASVRDGTLELVPRCKRFPARALHRAQALIEPIHRNMCTPLNQPSWKRRPSRN